MTRAQAQRVRELHLQGWWPREIAEQTGVSRAEVEALTPHPVWGTRGMAELMARAPGPTVKPTATKGDQ